MDRNKDAELRAKGQIVTAALSPELDRLAQAGLSGPEISAGLLMLVSTHAVGRLGAMGAAEFLRRAADQVEHWGEAWTAAGEA